MPHRHLVVLSSLLLAASVAGAKGWVPVLVPIPWKDAGMRGDRVFPTGMEVWLCTTDWLCEEIDPDPSAGRVVVDALGVHFEADVVSRVAGNRWEFGLEDIVLEALEGLQHLSVHVQPEARFEVPADGRDDVRHVAFRPTNAPSTPSALGIESVETFVPGDTVTRVTLLNFTVYAEDAVSPLSTYCNGAERPGIVLDDCIGAVEIFLPERRRPGRNAD